MLNMFLYLYTCHNNEMVFDLRDTMIDKLDFKLQDWTMSKFGHITRIEVLLLNMLEPVGMGFTIWSKVDADHAINSITWRQRTCFLVSFKNAPIYWMSKKQISVESSLF